MRTTLFVYLFKMSVWCSIVWIKLLSLFSLSSCFFLMMLISRLLSKLKIRFPAPNINEIRSLLLMPWRCDIFLWTKFIKCSVLVNPYEFMTFESIGFLYFLVRNLRSFLILLSTFDPLSCNFVTLMFIAKTL